MKESIKIITVIPKKNSVDTKDREPMKVTKPVETKPTINHIPQPEVPELIDSSKQGIGSGGNLISMIDELISRRDSFRAVEQPCAPDTRTNANTNPPITSPLPIPVSTTVEKPQEPEMQEEAIIVDDTNELNININSIVLLLNQILTDIRVLQDTVDSKKATALQVPPPPVTLTENISPMKRKIILNRDENGKILGADVIDSVEDCI